MTPDLFLSVIERTLNEVNAISLPGPGWTRPSYSDEESRAHDVIIGMCEELGLSVRRDAAGNLFARLPGEDRQKPAIHVGSHLDTVGQGGAYDGAAGVAAAMSLASYFVASGKRPPADFVISVLRAEESVWFPASYIGSRTALGRFDPDELNIERTDNGRSLADHMRDQGLDPHAAARIAAPAKARFLEFHIEQGPILAEANEPFAFISGIRGGLRYRNAAISGTWAHSGGAPRDTRADAVFAFADLVTAMDAGWENRLAAGEDLAVTFGIVDAASPLHAMAKVPGKLGFCLDLRSVDDPCLESVDADMRAIISDIEKNRPGVEFRLGQQSRALPMQLPAFWPDKLSRTAAELGQDVRIMHSGGGHDAAAFAAAGWDSGMIFIRNENGSHCPQEAMQTSDLAEAVAVAAHAILQDDQVQA